MRPAFYAVLDTQQPQTALIQFQRGSVGPWLTVATMTYSSLDQSCYFTRQVTLPASGSVRLAWSYPLTDIGQGGLTPAIAGRPCGDSLLPGGQPNAVGIDRLARRDGLRPRNRLVKSSGAATIRRPQGAGQVPDGGATSITPGG